MAITINSAGIFGIEGYKLEVECEISNGLPGHSIVGLPGTSVSESVERVRSAIKNLKYEYPVTKITLNLAPADIKKEGTVYDLPILLAILSKTHQIKPINPTDAFVGELSLNGKVRPIAGALSMAIALSNAGIKRFFVPFENAEEASFCQEIEVYPVNSADELLEHLNGTRLIEAHTRQNKDVAHEYDFDFSDVIGQENIKRAFEITASGMHNILVSGTPGSGKSMMAKRLVTILPELTYEEKLEVIRINSASGFTKESIEKASMIPFRSPHHTVSAVGLIGGIGTNKFPKPGEISLAHNGILFLDELPEFTKDSIEGLRAPLEDKKVTISRVSTTATYPADFVLVGAMNPCKCGYYGEDRCRCTELAVEKYQSKISGPMMDRIDIYCNVGAVEYSKIKNNEVGESSKEILQRVKKARNIQKVRFAGTKIKYNSQITPDKIAEFCKMTDDAETFLENSNKTFGLSVRSLHKVKKVARTIADMENYDIIQITHISEALQYRK